MPGISQMLAVGENPEELCSVRVFRSLTHNSHSRSPLPEKLKPSAT
jgi:hypothetical protein